MKKIAILFVIIIGLGAAIYFYTFHKPHKNTFSLEAKYKLSAQTLFDEFETDEDAANSKYLGKIIEIEGEIISVSKKADSYEISFVDELFGVTCLIDSIYAIQQKQELQQLKEGNTIKIKGQCNGYLSDVKLDRAVLVIE